MYRHPNDKDHLDAQWKLNNCKYHFRWKGYGASCEIRLPMKFDHRRC